jgi:hypothetical protein
MDIEIQHCYRDITIYRTYAEDDYDMPYSYWFSLYNDNNDEDYTNFDIREFETYDDYQSINRNLEHAIIAGLITLKGFKYKLSDTEYISQQ